MPTAQARLTRARGLHATRRSIRSDNDRSSLPERRVSRRFFFFRWHRALTCHTLDVRTGDLHRPMAWFPGAYDLRALSWAYVRVWGAAGRGCRTPAWPGNAHFVWFSYVNRALFGTATSADRWPGSQAHMTCAPCPGHMCASGEPLGAAAARRLGRGMRTLRILPM
jgi:hypothetical protein